MKKVYQIAIFPFKEWIGLYKHGFNIMSKESKMLWVIAIVKLLVMFGILKIFFFKDFLKANFDSDEQRIEYLQEKFTEIKK